jgi:Tfp pilus assembly protein PilO
MKEISSPLRENERKLLRLLSLLLLFVLVFFFFVSLGQRRGCLRLVSELQAREKVAADAEKFRAASAEEWARWEQAYQDMEDLKKTYFYKEEEGVNELRLDLQKIFAEAGITARSLRYNYVSLEKEKVKKINVTFTFSGSYLILKKFLGTIERFPKFLLLEKIDFMKVSGEGSLLELRIILTGYYESF